MEKFISYAWHMISKTHYPEGLALKTKTSKSTKKRSRRDKKWKHVIESNIKMYLFQRIWRKVTSGARFRRNVNEERFCDASHITRHWTCANPYDLIDATEPFGSALANRFLTLGLFCFCSPTMWWCRCAHTPRQGSDPVWSFRYHSGNNYDLMT